MAYKCLADFLEELSASGELVRVAAEVDADLEIAEITRRVAAEGGPALLFEQIGGQLLPMVTNLLGTPQRACRALGIESLDELPERLEALIAEHTPQNWFDRLKMGSPEGTLDKLRPKAAKLGACQQVVHLGRDVNLAAFPLVRSLPEDTGPAITAGLIITQSPDGSSRGVTRVPLAVLDENRLAAFDDPNSPLARHRAAYAELGEQMSAAVVLGGDPALPVLAALELPHSLDVLHLAGLLRGRPLEVVKCRTHALEVPAEAEMIFEGYFEPSGAEASVRLGRDSNPAAVLHVAAVTHRNRAILPTVIDIGAAGEAMVLARARERTLLPALRKVAPDLVDLYLPLLGGPHRLAIAAIRSRSAGHARQIAAALWGTEALKFTRFLVLVDAGVDVQDLSRVWAEIGANVDPRRDVISWEGPAWATAGDNALERHLAIDATSKQPADAGAEHSTAEEIRRMVTSRWAEYGLPLPPDERGITGL